MASFSGYTRDPRYFNGPNIMYDEQKLLYGQFGASAHDSGHAYSTNDIEVIISKWFSFSFTSVLYLQESTLRSVFHES